MQSNAINLQGTAQTANLSDASVRSSASAYGDKNKVTAQLWKATTDKKEFGCVDKRNLSLKYFPTADTQGNPLLAVL